MTSHGVAAFGRALLSASRRSNSASCAGGTAPASTSWATLSKSASATAPRPATARDRVLAVLEL